MKKNKPCIQSLFFASFAFTLMCFVKMPGIAQCTFYQAYTSTPHVGFSFAIGGADFSSCTPIGRSFFTNPGASSRVTINFYQTLDNYPGFRVWGMNSRDSIALEVNGNAYPLTAASASIIPMFTCGTSVNSDVAFFANGYLVGTDTSVNESRAYIDVILNTTAVSNIKLYSHAVSGWGFAGALSNCTVVPVTLVSFKAIEKGNAVLLQWSTASEMNANYFDVQNSKDAMRWQHIGNKIAAGNSNSIQFYTLQHDRPSAGINYYRLKQIDADGRYNYSNIQAVDIKNASYRVTPNPSSGYFIINGSNISSVTVLNAAGIVLQKKQNNAGNGITIDMHNYPPGVYFANIFQSSGSSVVEKLVKY